MVDGLPLCVTNVIIKNKMENFKIKVTILTLDDKKVKEMDFDSMEFETIKGETGRDIIGDGVSTFLEDMRINRRSNPHHHTNRLD